MFIREYLPVFLVATVISLAVSFCIKPTIIRETSMEPTFQNNDFVIVNKLAYKGDKAPSHKDIIVFKCTNKESDFYGRLLIKRVIGLPGDKIEINNGNVYRNDKLLSEDYTKGENITEDETVFNVPSSSVFVMGDHRDVSLDSRFKEVGYISEDDILGKVAFEIPKIKIF